MGERDPELDVYDSQTALNVMLLATLIMAAGALAVIFGAFPALSEDRRGGAILVGSYVALPFLGLAIVQVIQRLRRQSRPVISLRRSGILDVRLSDAPIPWSAITAVRPSKLGGRVRGSILDADREFAKKHDWHRLAVLIGWPGLGRGSVTILAGGTTINGDELHRLCVKYWNQYRKGFA
ncbi:MAG: hypothetical protein EOP22_00635 [Hyphomicrobiales bacterium]|nr:MAG: hypothetical protein EOP22_00635 [Hyphomicrobiales bacterium]